MTRDDILTEAEAAELMRLLPATVRTLGRRGLIRRIPPARPPRYTRASVVAYLSGEVYDALYAEPDRQAPPEEAAPRAGDRRPPHRPLASAPVGGGGALPRRLGPSAGDVVVRRVQG